MPLDSADITTLSRLLDEALELSADEREPWMAALPPADQPYAARLREMLTAQAETGTARPLSTLPKLGPDEATAHAGDRVGPYRLLHEIGQGGMGSVWLAERADGSYERSVALKLPHVAWGSGLADRMARERRIGALLEHPNIARLYDAGVDEQHRPYLAFEYIEGVPIDLWCETRSLSVPSRLRLVVQVARAVAYAHARLIVHRDLKPSNILVSKDGQAHLLDFGIAALLCDAPSLQARLTQEHGRVLTPSFASPEQIRGDDVTVQSDVYSLGVLAFELLAGRSPYVTDRRSLGALEEAVLAGDLPLASSRAEDAASAKALRGEVDAIVAKAVKCEPAHRYATADAMAEDIERYLSGERVLAQPDSTWYRLRKSIRRHRTVVAATALVLAAVVGGTTAALLQAGRAAREARRALIATEFLSEMFRASSVEESANLTAAKASPTRFLDRGAQMIESRFVGEPALQAQLYGIVGQAYADMGSETIALKYATRQLELLESTAADRGQVVRALLLLAQALRAQEKDAEAEANARKALALANQPDESRALALVTLAGLQRASGKVDQARANMQAAEALFASMRRNSGIAWAYLLEGQGLTLSLANDFENALPLLRRAIDAAVDAEGPHSRTAALMRVRLARALMQRAREAEARPLLDAALAGMRAGGGSGEVLAALAAAEYASYAFWQNTMSYEDALEVLHASRSTAAQTLAAPASVRARIDVAAAEVQIHRGNCQAAAGVLGSSASVIKAETSSVSRRAKVLVQEGELAKCLGHHDEAHARFSELRDIYLMRKVRTAWDSYAWASIALNLGMQGRYDEAEQVAVEAPEFSADGPAMGAVGGYAARIVPDALARVRLDRGDASGALRALPNLLQLATEGNTVQSELILLGEVLCANGEPSKGLPFLVAGIEWSARHASDSHPEQARARAAAGLCALDMGDVARARQLAAAARKGFSEQPDVSPYYKQPWHALEQRLAKQDGHAPRVSAASLEQRRSVIPSSWATPPTFGSTMHWQSPKEAAMDDLGELIRRVNDGNAGARDALFAAAYGELRKLARSRLRDGGRNTVLDTTALVHESYLRFLNGGQLRSDNRRAFFAYASRVMRSVIIDAVRERQAERRGGDLKRLTLNTQVSDSLPAGEDELLKVHEALEMLAQAEPRLAKVVEMRYFGGYSEVEIGEALELTERTVRRDWDKARLLLGAMLKD